ncbi:MAG: hypothetical protein NZ585_04845 [Chloracidobacterium sp.]|nr:hypothetical protein [Chloracidobacterium sp.]MDW8216811.1 hypothetical protein [Acidobacteriota bacterium]
MSSGIGLDVRIPIGVMFVLMGLALVGYGWMTNGVPGFYDKSLGININLWWGLAMMLFGGALLAPALLKKP